jgi:3-oxoacyl-[acyl-carrier-protein] synthase II
MLEKDRQSDPNREKNKYPRRVVITGIGCVAPNGIGKEAFWAGLREGRNCVDKITFFDVSNFPSKAAAEIRDFKPSDFISESNEIKRTSRSAHLAIAGAKLALMDARLQRHKTPELSVIIGSSTSGVEYLLPEAYAFERSGITKVRPYVGIAGFVGSISSEVSRFIGAQGPSLTLSTGCTSSTDAMGYALRQIQYGFSDIVVSGGSDACVSDGILAAFCRMGATSTRNHDFKRASRPFNKDRDGFVIAEGAWIFLLEELEHALARKANIYGELRGYGASCDAWHMTKPDPTGEPLARAIRMAIEDAGIQPEEVDLFEAYGNSTPINDSYETAVIKKVFEKHANDLVVPSVKSMIGHPIGAAGSAQVASALLALNGGFIHPTINYEVPDPECDLDYVPNQGRKGKFDIALCNSLAFGGKNACLVIRSFKG